MTLPYALMGLTFYPQFIVYKTVPKANNPTRLDKLPVDWRTCRVASAQDQGIWTSYAQAAQSAAVMGRDHGVGFVITENDPFWFIDIDDCRSSAGWSTLALELCRQLAGCAIEVSLSGEGLHLIGSGVCPPHSCAPSATLGLYTEGRFVALGGLPGATGDVNADLSHALPDMVARYFPLDTAPSVPQLWTTGPRADWRGPTNDDDLIRRACAAKSAGSTFGQRATFNDLWTANIPALTLSYPAEDGRPYDGSSADAALVQHLAFWTGHDCERIKRLMLKSALVRDKWQVAGYLKRTIMGACAAGANVCMDTPVEAVVTERPERVTGARILSLDEQTKFFEGCVYVTESDGIFTPSGAILSQSRFNAVYGGFTFVTSIENASTTKKPYDAFVASQGINFPKVSQVEFNPLREPGEIWVQDGTRTLNSYVPVFTPRSNESVEPFERHLRKLFPVEQDRLIIEAYMAAVVQYPGVKFQWAPLIQGAPGNGKTLLARCLVAAIGQKYCHAPKPAELASRFNDFLDGKIFINVEDIYRKNNSQDIVEALAGMITSEYLEIEGKGQNKRTRRVCANFMINSNHVDGVQKQRWDRRYAMFFTPHQSFEDIARDGMSGAYFPDLYRWLRKSGYAAINGWLRRYAIRDDLNPATTCQRAPGTSSTDTAIRQSATPVEQEIENAIEGELIGFRQGWVSSFYLDTLIKATGFERSIPRNMRRKLMIDAGFILHPGLHDGRVNNNVMPDGIKPRLYVKPDHPTIGMTGQVVADAYSAAQLAI